MCATILKHPTKGHFVFLKPGLQQPPFHKKINSSIRDQSVLANVATGKKFLAKLNTANDS